LAARLAVFTLLATLVPTIGAAQNQFKFNTLSPQGGLYYDGVIGIEQDGDGFVWVLLENDLLRFDGYEYKHYHSQFRSDTGSSKLQVHSIATDSRGVLHVSSVQGLFRYDRLNDRFDRLLDRSYHISFDSRDSLWVSRSGQFGVLSGVDSLDVKRFEGREVSNVATTCSSSDGSFLVACHSGQILRYDHSTGTFSLFHTLPREYTILRMQRQGNRLWVLLHKGGLASIDIPSRTLTAIDDFPLKHNGREIVLRDMIADKNGHLWIATQQGLWFFDPATMERQLYRHHESDMFSIPHNSVWSLSEGRDENIWIGTFSGGLCMVDPDDTRGVTTYVSRHSGLNHNSVSAFADDGNVLWIGTEGGGVNRLDRQTGRVSWLNPSDNAALPSNHIKSLVRDGVGGLWIATYLGGLTRYDIAGGVFRHYSEGGGKSGGGNNDSGKSGKSGETNGLISNNLRKIVPQGNRGVWIAYQTGRHVVSFLPYGGGAIEHRRFDVDSPQFYILDMWLNGDDLWIVTEQKLYRMSVAGGGVADVSSADIPWLNARSMGVDDGGNVWVGTVNGSLLCRDAATGRITTVASLTNHNVTTVYSICFDPDGALWMGTDNGLFRYDRATKRFSRFDESDGMQGRMYNPLAAMTTADGKLVFGGTNGFSIVDPHTVAVCTRKPKAIVSAFVANNAIAAPRFGGSAGGTHYGREIVVDHSTSSFGFRLAADNYAAPSKTRFRYRLEGHDRNWVTLQPESRTAIWSNMPAGHYRFTVEAGVDGENWGSATTVAIVKRPAPWNSAWAWTVYIGVVLTVAGTLIYYRVEKQRLKMQLFVDQLDKQKREEIHQSQLRFFTNISHDFRTPLSLITGAVDNLRSEWAEGAKGRGGARGADDKYWNIVNNNAHRLLNLVNELMDFRTIENGAMQLQMEHYEVNRLVGGVAADFSAYAREKSIEFRVDCDPLLSGWAYLDRTVVEKIVMNLLNNAFKYTPRGGSITISTRGPGREFTSAWRNSFRIDQPDSEADKRFSIVVSDTGVGISSESISKVFERFYKVNTANADSHLGTGIGLALVKSLVLLHHGSITIFSERDRGTDMVVELPFAVETGIDAATNDAAASPTPAENPLDMAGKLLATQRKTVLLVEDNDELRDLVTDFLSADYNVVQAADGHEATKWLAANEVDLVISDIMMPGKDGVALLREIKTSAATSHIPVILLTAKTGIESKLEGAGFGADIYFEKPVDLNLLRLSIENIFNQQTRLREYYSKNHFAESGDVVQNRHDSAFLKKLIDVVDRNLTEPILDVNFIASELSMNHTKLYSRMKALTGRSTVEFILSYRLQKAARLMIENGMNAQQAMESVGIRSQSYFTGAFKKEFGETPSAFARSHSRRTTAPTAPDKP
jgi:signal transduction histidine kinase/ligand-binding sensor domain-containing protein/DNA-binding NarL/FixJ family response regulator